MLEGGPLPWIVDTSGYYEEGETIFLYKLLHPKQIPVDSIIHRNHSFPLQLFLMSAILSIVEALPSTVSCLVTKN